MINLNQILSEIEDTKKTVRDTKENLNDLKLKLAPLGVWLRTITSNLEHIELLVDESIKKNLEKKNTEEKEDEEERSILEKLYRATRNPNIFMSNEKLFELFPVDDRIEYLQDEIRSYCCKLNKEDEEDKEDYYKYLLDIFKSIKKR